MAARSITQPDNSTRNTERETLQARLQALQSGTNYGLLANLVAASVVSGHLWGIVDAAHLAAWLMFMLLTLAGRFVLHRAYCRSPLSISDNLHWRHLVALTAIAIGFGWGWFGLILFPLLEDGNQVLLLLLVLVLVSAHVIAPFRASAGAFLLLAGLPTLVQLFAQGNPTGSLLSSALLLILLGVQWVTLEILLTEINKNAQLRRSQGWSDLERMEYMRAAETANRLFAQALVEQETAEANLELAKQAAEKANRAKGEFLAYTSHEIRTPLSAVIGLTRVLLDTSLTDKQRDYLRRIRNAGGRLLALINGLLDMSKIEAGKLEIENNEFRLRELLDEVIQEQNLIAQEKGIGLDLEIGGAVPNFLVGDSLRVGQVMRNLVGNAIKFTRNGKVTITVSLTRTEGEKAYILFSVVDSGIGIPQEKQKILFERYSQADTSTTRTFGGTGLGLAISKSLCELMSGTIGLRSEPNKGSEFFFELPFNIRPQPSVPPAKAVGAIQPTRRLKVLVAEDNDDNQLVIELLLNDWGAQVTIVGDGQLAIAEVVKNQFDLVLMDLEMPVMNGFQAVAAIREHEKKMGGHVPIVALSAHALVGYRERCLTAGMDDYVTKPVDRNALYGLLDVYAARQITVSSVATESSQ